MQIRAHPQMNMAALGHRVQPLDSELINAKRHRGTARIRLAKSFDVSRIVPIGSHARGTAIRSYSDLDMMVVLRRNEAKWSKPLMAAGWNAIPSIIIEKQEALGLDAIDMTLRQQAGIEAFLDRDRRVRPWIYLAVP